MKKRVFVFYGWAGFPREGWFPWLKKELQKNGFSVTVLKMPSPHKPTIQNWVSFLRKKVGPFDENTFFIGHSIGSQTIIRFLARSKGNKAGGVVLVAPWAHLFPSCIPTLEEKAIARPWLKTPLPWAAARKKAQHFTCVFSTNDPCVPLSDSKVFKKKLGAKIIVLKNKKHFSGSEGIDRLPVVRAELLKLVR